MIKPIGASAVSLALGASLIAGVPQAHAQETDQNARRSAGLWDPGLPLAGATYHQKRNRITVSRLAAKKNVVVAYKLKRTTHWRNAERCWNHGKKGSTDSCKWKRYKGKKIHENKKVFWRLCLGLYAKRRKHQVIKWNKDGECTKGLMTRR